MGSLSSGKQVAPMHDIHIHTSLSSCARQNSELSDYLGMFPRLGVSVAGFSNHLWDSAVPGAGEWYRPQNIEHLLVLKQQLKEASLPGVKFYFGCEVEYIGNGVISLHPEHAGIFDYVLAAPNHFHMVDFVRPSSISGGDELNHLFASRFLDICGFDFVTGIAHPFFPMGFPGREAEILDRMPDPLLEECFRTAAGSGKSIEINISILCKLKACNALENYKRIMIIARDCGCRFHIGSDAHGMCHYTEERFLLGKTFADSCGIRLPEDPLKGSAS